MCDVSLADDPTRVAYVRQHGARHAEEVQELIVPLATVDIVEERARGVGGIGHMPLSRRQLPGQPTVDSTEGQITGHGALTGQRHVLEQPRQLGPTEVRIEKESRPSPDQRLVAGLTEALAERRRAPVLPDDGGSDGLRGRAVPHDRRLALIGDSQSGNVAGRDAAARQGLNRGSALGLPELLGVLLDPPRLGERAPQLLLRDGQDRARLVDDQGPRTARPLVESEDHGAARRTLRRHRCITPSSGDRLRLGCRASAGPAYPTCPPGESMETLRQRAG